MTFCPSMRRLGRFYLDSDLVEQDFFAAKRILGNFVIMRCEYLYHRHAFEYVAASALFDCVERGDEIPEYEIVVDDADSHVEARKVQR